MEEEAGGEAFADKVESRIADLVSRLADKKACINQVAQHGNTPLMLSCERGGYSITQRMIDCKASVEPPDIDGITDVEGPLEAALRANNGHRSMPYNNRIRERLVQLLLESGASASRLGVLNHAVSQSGVPTRCVELLLEYAADVNAMDDTHTLPLFAALEAGHSHMAHLLMEMKAAVDLYDYRSRNIYHAVACGDYTWESELPWDTENPTVPATYTNARDAAGQTPLSIATMNGSHGIAAWLLALGADPDDDSL